MHSITDERNWLTWLVKVRILILMVLLAIELAIIRLTPSSLPIMPFLTAMVLWFVFSLFFSVSGFSLERTSFAGHPASACRSGHGHSRRRCNGRHRQFAEFSLSPGHRSCLHAAARVWGYLSAGLAFILFGGILELDYYLVIPSFASSHPKLKALQVVIFVNLFAYFAIAYLAGLLMSKLRQVDVQLKDASGALQNLQALHENIVQSMSGGVITTGPRRTHHPGQPGGPAFTRDVRSRVRGRSVGDLFQDPLPHFGVAHSDAEVRYLGVNGFRKTFRVMVSALNVNVRGDLVLSIPLTT